MLQATGGPTDRPGAILNDSWTLPDITQVAASGGSIHSGGSCRYHSPGSLERTTRRATSRSATVCVAGGPQVMLWCPRRSVRQPASPVATGRAGSLDQPLQDGMNTRDPCRPATSIASRF